MTVRAEAQIDLARVDDGAAGQNGATFTPSVDAAGDISWTNDGGLPNPQTQNIMGPQGDPGTPGTNGVSVTAVEPQYYLSTSDSSATGGSWSSTPATFVSGCYYWTRDYITFSDGTNDTSTEVYNAGMTQAAQDAYDALTLADDTNQYFWYAPTGADTGAHITEVPQDEWNDISDPNYHSGGNLLARTNGIAVRDGMTELATFGASGAVVGQNANGKSRTEIGTAGMQIVQNVSGTDTAIANLGYGPGIDSGGGTSNAPYYTLGLRTGTIGNYSVVEGGLNEASAEASHAEGNHTTASGYESHAEGSYTTASAQRTHAEGYNCTASYLEAHAEGSNTTASSRAAHSEGRGTVASGGHSHAQNYYTIAASMDQTAIGKYNVADSNNDYSLIIGNGTADNARSNALTVDWAGDVFLALDTTAASGTDHDLYAAITALGWGSDLVSSDIQDVKKTLTKILEQLKKPHIKTADKTSASKSISANAAGYIDVDMSGVAPSGYTLVGIVALTSNASGAVPISWQIYSSSTIRVYYRNVTSAAVSQTVAVTGLYQLTI